MLLKVSAVISLLVLEASAFWRLPCDSRVALERIDPIVNPGGISAHVHTIHGPNCTFLETPSGHESCMADRCLE